MDHSGRVRGGAGGGSDGVETSGGDGGAPQLSPRLLKLNALGPRLDTLTFTNVRASLT